MYNAMMDDEMWKTLRGQYWEKGTWPNSWRCLVQGWVALDDLCGFLPAQHVLWSPQYKMLIKLSISASRLSSVMGISMQGYRWLFIKIQEFSLQPELKCLHVFSGEIHFWRKNPFKAELFISTDHSLGRIFTPLHFYLPSSVTKHYN